MAAWTAAARAERTPAPRTHARTRTARRTRPERRHVTGSVLWIGVLAALLAGVVAMNVAVLRLNMRLDRLGRERASLRAENAALYSQLSSAAATGRIQALAMKRLGYAPASSAQTTYVDIGR